MIRTIFILVLLFSLVQCSNAQKISKDIRNIDGTNYYVHEIKKKETLYAISKAYSVHMDTIVNHNSSLKQGQLKEGEVVFIPIQHSSETESPASDSSKITVLVTKGTTLYSLSKEYEVSIDSLLNWNPSVKNEGLKLDQEIIIHKNLPSVKTDTYADTLDMDSTQAIFQNSLNTLWSRFDTLSSLDSTETGSFEMDTTVPLVLKDTFQISYFMPFFLEQNKEKMANKEEVYFKSKPALDLYNGSLLALDSLRKMGMNIKVNFFDSNSDSTELSKLINSSRFAANDLIIGPLYQEKFKLISDHANLLDIPIACPVPISSELLLSAEHTYAVFPSYLTHFQHTGNYICDHFSKEKLIIIDQDLKHKEVAYNLIHKFNLLHSMDASFILDSALYLNFFELDIDKVIKSLSPTKKNILLVMSEDKPFVSDLMTKLYLETQHYDVITFGSEKWKKFHYLDPVYFKKLNVHVPSSQHIDEKDPHYIEFKKKLLSKFGALPSKYTLSGYNTTLYFGSLLSIHGKMFTERLKNKTYNGLGMNFEFVSRGKDIGFENKSLYILKYSNFGYLSVSK